MHRIAINHDCLVGVLLALAGYPPPFAKVIPSECIAQQQAGLPILGVEDSLFDIVQGALTLGRPEPVCRQFLGSHLQLTPCAGGREHWVGVEGYAFRLCFFADGRDIDSIRTNAGNGHPVGFCHIPRRDLAVHQILPLVHHVGDNRFKVFGEFAKHGDHARSRGQFRGFQFCADITCGHRPYNLGNLVGGLLGLLHRVGYEIVHFPSFVVLRHHFLGNGWFHLRKCAELHHSGDRLAFENESVGFVFWHSKLLCRHRGVGSLWKFLNLDDADNGLCR